MFRFLNVSPSTERRIRNRKAAKTKITYKLAERMREERMSRYMRALSVEEKECVEAVAEGEECKMSFNNMEDLDSKQSEVRVPCETKP